MTRVQTYIYQYDATDAVSQVAVKRPKLSKILIREREVEDADVGLDALRGHALGDGRHAALCLKAETYLRCCFAVFRANRSKLE